jgi:hypothetical protein
VANRWQRLIGRTPTLKQRQASESPPREQAAAFGPKAQARTVLGVTETASDAEVVAAYHRLAQLYHPDRVAGLATEFQALADNRMKQINAAYDVLKRRMFSMQPEGRIAQPVRLGREPDGRPLL